MIDLPHGIGETLTMLPFDPVWLVRLLVWAIIAACLAIWLWLAGRKKATTRSQHPRRSRSKNRQTPSNFAKSIKKISKRTHKTKDWRGGCHELSTLVRSHAEQVTGFPFEERTVVEIKNSLPDGPIAPFFDQLSTLQFSRAAPNADDFDEACSDAMALDRKKRIVTKRRAG